jgi:hypothetical protein
VKSEKIRHFTNTLNKPISARMLITIFILLALLIVLIIIIHKKILRNLEPQGYIISIKKDTMSIFIPTSQEKLGKKTLEIKGGLSEREKADIIIKELKKEKCVSDKLMLHELAIDQDGIMYLNFSKEILDTKTRGVSEITMVYTIVNSFLSNFGNAKKVQLLIEGQPVYTINGLIYTYMPIEFNQTLLED